MNEVERNTPGVRPTGLVIPEPTAEQLAFERESREMRSLAYAALKDVMADVANDPVVRVQAATVLLQYCYL